MTSAGGAGLERVRPGSVVITAVPRWLLCLCLCLCLAVSRTAAQVNVEFDGEMLAEESSRVSQKSWLPWSRGSSSRKRSGNRVETSSVRPVFLSEPWREETWLPPPPVLSHLANPYSGRLPSLRFPLPPPREQQQNQWNPRPPPGAPSSATALPPLRTGGGDVGQEWGDANKPSLESSETGDRAQYDNPSGDLADSERQKYVLAGRRQSAKPLRGDYQSRAPVRIPARRQEPAVADIRAVSADRREFVEPSGNQVTEPPQRLSRPQATRRRYDTSARGQVTAARQRHRAVSRAPAAAGGTSDRQSGSPRPRGATPSDTSGRRGATPSDTNSRQPVDRTEAQRLPESRRRPWRPESARQPAEEQDDALGRPTVTRGSDRPGSATTSSGGAAEADSRDRGSEGPTAEWQRPSAEWQRPTAEWQRPTRRRIAGSLRRGRPVPPPSSLDYARLALGAVAANEAAASLEANDRSSSRHTVERGGDRLTAAADYGWRNTEATPTVDADHERDIYQHIETEYTGTDEETEPEVGLSLATEELSGTAGTDEDDSNDESEQFTELNPLTDVETEPESAAYSTDVAAELAALSALLSGPRDAADGGSSSAPYHQYKPHGMYYPAVTRAALSSEDVIRVPIGRPLRYDTSTASVSDDISTSSPSVDTSTASVSDDTSTASPSDDIGTASVWDDAGTASLNDDTSTASDSDDTSSASADEVAETQNEEGVVSAPDVASELSEAVPAHTAEHTVPESMSEDRTEYDYYDYDEYYDYAADPDVDSVVDLPEPPTTSVTSESPTTLSPLVAGIQRFVINERPSQTGHTVAASRRPGDTGERTTVTTERPSPMAPEQVATEGLLGDEAAFRRENVKDSTRDTSRDRTTHPSDAPIEAQTTRASVQQDEVNFTSTPDKEDEEYLYRERNESDSPKAEPAQPLVAETETEEAHLSDGENSWEGTTASYSDVINSTESGHLSDKGDWWDGTTASYSDVINNVIGEVIQDIFHGTETTPHPQVIAAEGETVNDIQYPEYNTELYDTVNDTVDDIQYRDIQYHDIQYPEHDTELPAGGEAVNDIYYPEYDTDLYDDVVETLTTHEPTGSAFESIYDESDSLLTSTEVTEDALDTWYEDEVDVLRTTTKAATDVTFEPIYTEEMGTPATTEATEHVTLKAEPAELQVQPDATTKQPLSTSPATTTTNPNRYSEETSTETYTSSTSAYSDPATGVFDAFITADGSESVTSLYTSGLTSLYTSGLVAERTTSRPAQPSADDGTRPTAMPEISTLSPRTRLYLFSNFPEFTGSEQRSLERGAESPDDQGNPEGATESNGDQRSLEGSTQSPNPNLSAEKAESSSPVTITQRPVSVIDDEYTVTTESAVAATISAEPTTSVYSPTRQQTMSYPNVIATRTTAEPDLPHTDVTSSGYSTPYEFSTAVTESKAVTETTAAPAEATTTETLTSSAAERTSVTRRPIPNLQSRPTFSKFYRFGKGAPVATTEPSTTERTSTQRVSEPTTSQTTTEYSSTQHTTLPISSFTQPFTVRSSAPPPVTSSTLATPATAEGTVAAGPPPPSKPSLDEVRSAIQPFSLAEMLVESGQSLAGFLRSDYTMPDVLAIIERLRARREGRPVTASERSRVTTEATERAAGTPTTPGGTGTEAGRITATRPSSAALEDRLPDGTGAQETLLKDDVLPSGRRVLPAASLDESEPDLPQWFGGVPTETAQPSSAAPPVRRRKQWSLAEILDEKQISLPAFLAQGGDVKQLLLEYNGVALSAGGGDGPTPKPATTPPPSGTTATRIYSLAEILSLRRQTLKQFISSGGSVRAILEEYNGVGWRPPKRSTTEAPDVSSRVPAFLTRSTAFPGAAAGTEGATAEEATWQPEELRPLLGEGGRHAAAGGGKQRGSRPGIRLMTRAPPIYGRPASMPPPPLDDPRRLPPAPPPGPDAPQFTLPPVLPPDELFERINQETEAMWAAAGGDSGGGGGDGDQHHQVDSTVFDIELSPSASAISPAVRDAVIASGVVGGCALLFFIALLLFCKWRQRREQQALRPGGLAVGSERSSSPLDPSRINVNNYANAYRQKTTGFWGSLRKSFNQRYAAAYSDSPYGGVST